MELFIGILVFLVIITAALVISVAKDRKKEQRILQEYRHNTNKYWRV